MDTLTGFDNLIQDIQFSNTEKQLEEYCQAFCQRMGFDNFLVFGSIFTSLLSPPSLAIGDLGKGVRRKRQRLETITRMCMNNSSPIISGKFKNNSLLNNKLLNPVKRAPTKGVSISIPVHYPIGKFAFLHISTNETPTNPEQHIMQTLINGNLFARQAGDAVLRLLEAELETKPPYLVPRERECLLLASDGASPHDIAKQLGLSPHTVIFHLKKAREKLDSKNIQGALSKAILQGEVKTIVDSERR